MYLLLHKCPQSVGPQHRPSLEDIRPYHDGAFCPSASACSGNVASNADRIIPRFISVFSPFLSAAPPRRGRRCRTDWLKVRRSRRDGSRLDTTSRTGGAARTARSLRWAASQRKQAAPPREKQTSTDSFRGRAPPVGLVRRAYEQEAEGRRPSAGQLRPRSLSGRTR